MDQLLVALDVDTASQALALAEKLRGVVGGFKIGSRLFTSQGPSIVEELAGRGDRVFLDLKFHDIPNTVAAACRAAAGLGVWMLNVHASGGRRMMEAARDALAGQPRRPLLIAVTVLTSMAADDLAEIGVDASPAEQVLRLARLTQACKLDGAVCSAQEAALLRAALGADFRLVTPGIRPAGSDAGDQRRVMTPGEAVAAGATDLVIGRPITAAADPVAVLQSINAEIRSLQGAVK
jgi:orotidine-5'-phosphate decarboxylase